MATSVSEVIVAEKPLDIVERIHVEGAKASEDRMKIRQSAADNAINMKLFNDTPISFAPCWDMLESAVEQALVQEAALSPKPGLVDSLNNGAHHDMCLDTFVKSARAIAPFMPVFAEMGYQHQHLPSEDILPMIRPLGMACEKAMFGATNGVNTHKGAVFAFSLLCTAMGYGYTGEQMRAGAYTHELCQTVALFCKDLVARELEHGGKNKTAGSLAYQQHGLTGARGEAESGFAAVRNIGLPLYQSLVEEQTPAEMALLHVLMNYLAYNEDTNLVSRGGIAGLRQAQQMVIAYLQQNSVFADEGLRQLREMDEFFTARRWSPGGSADLLAVTIFLHDLEKLGAVAHDG